MLSTLAQRGIVVVCTKRKFYIQGILCDQKWVSINRRNLGVNRCQKKAKKGVIFRARARARAPRARIASNIVGNIFCKAKKNNQNADTCREDIQKPRKPAPVWWNVKIFENAAPRIQTIIHDPRVILFVVFHRKITLNCNSYWYFKNSCFVVVFVWLNLSKKCPKNIYIKKIAIPK